MIDRDTFLGAMLGAALGDAMGRPTEFAAAPNAGREHVDLPCPALVTDDTQLALAVAWALQDEDGTLEARLVRRLVQWVEADHHEGRSPGATCVSSATRLAELDDPADWPKASDPESRGNGGVMRAHSAILMTEPGDPAPLLQSAMTHAHPVACAAVLAWEGALRSAAAGDPPQDWIDAAYRALDIPCPPLLNPLEEHPEYPRGSWWEIGVAETRSSLLDARDALDTWDDLEDPCRLSGPGWIAEEAVATALVVAIRYAQDPVGALRRAARTCGDSDTLASMTGALVGARHGVDAWPAAWVEALEEEYCVAIRGLRPT